GGLKEGADVRPGGGPGGAVVEDLEVVPGHAVVAVDVDVLRHRRVRRPQRVAAHPVQQHVAADRKDQEVLHGQLGGEVGAEGEGGAGLDLERLEGGGGDDVVGDGGARVDVHHVAGAGQAAERPDGRVGPGAALDADDGGVRPEVGDLQVRRHEVRVRHRRGVDRCGGGDSGSPAVLVPDGHRNGVVPGGSI